MKKILFVTDFSENSKKSFAYALQFTKQYNAEISLVHIYKKPRSYDDPYKEYTVQQEKIEIAAERLLRAGSGARLCDDHKQNLQGDTSARTNQEQDPGEWTFRRY